MGPRRSENLRATFLPTLCFTIPSRSENRGAESRIDGGEIYEVQKPCFWQRRLGRSLHPHFAEIGTPRPVINPRKENHEDRIANGVPSGQLTAGETRNLETRQSARNGEENRMKKGDDGNLTAADKARLTPQNLDSAAIYREKHNRRKR